MAKQTTAPAMVEPTKIETPVNDASNGTEPQKPVETQQEPEPKSEAMQKLEKEHEEAKAAYQAARFNPEIDIDELNRLGTVVTGFGKKKADLTASENNARIAAALQERRNKQKELGLVRDRAYYEMRINENDETVSAYNAAKDVVDNYLMGASATRVAGKPTETGTKPAATPTGPRGGKSAAIRDLIVPMYAAGKTGAEVRAFIKTYPSGVTPWDEINGGFNDGTANGVIKAYEREIGLA